MCTTLQRASLDDLAQILPLVADYHAFEEIEIAFDEEEIHIQSSIADFENLDYLQENVNESVEAAEKLLKMCHQKHYKFSRKLNLIRGANILGFLAFVGLFSESRGYFLFVI